MLSFCQFVRWFTQFSREVIHERWISQRCSNTSKMNNLRLIGDNRPLFKHFFLTLPSQTWFDAQRQFNFLEKHTSCHSITFQTFLTIETRNWRSMLQQIRSDGKLWKTQAICANLEKLWEILNGFFHETDGRECAWKCSLLIGWLFHKKILFICSAWGSWTFSLIASVLDVELTIFRRFFGNLMRLSVNDF